MSPRTLSFASLLVASSAFADAPTPIAEVDGAAPSAVAAPSQDVQLAATWETEVRGGELHVRLSVTNHGINMADLVLRRGRSPGVELAAMAGDVALDPILDPVALREQSSRMGPMPVWGPVAPGATAVIGVYRFKLPRGLRSAPIVLEGEVYHREGLVRVSTVVGATPVS
jgi:hypothetical protein